MKIQKILFPTDFSPTAQNAFQHCLAIAGTYQARIVVLHVVYPEYAVMDLPMLAASTTLDKADAARVALTSFVEWGYAKFSREQPQAPKPQVDILIEMGAPISNINYVADREQVDLIIMGSKGVHNSLEKTFGTVSTGVLEQAQRPVMVVPEKALWQGFHVVAYGSDGSSADLQHWGALGEMLAPFAAVLHIVHIQTEQQAEVLETGDWDRPQALTPVLQVQYHLAPGPDVELGLEEFAETHEVNLLVMHAPTRSFIQRFFHHSHTRRMALLTKVPLLVIKGEG